MSMGFIILMKYCALVYFSFWKIFFDCLNRVENCLPWTKVITPTFIFIQGLIKLKYIGWKVKFLRDLKILISGVQRGWNLQLGERVQAVDPVYDPGYISTTNLLYINTLNILYRKSIKDFMALQAFWYFNKIKYIICGHCEWRRPLRVYIQMSTF